MAEPVSLPILGRVRVGRHQLSAFAFAVATPEAGVVFGDEGGGGFYVDHAGLRCVREIDAAIVLIDDVFRGLLFLRVRHRIFDGLKQVAERALRVGFRPVTHKDAANGAASVMSASAVGVGEVCSRQQGGEGRIRPLLRVRIIGGVPEAVEGLIRQGRSGRRFWRHSLAGAGGEQYGRNRNGENTHGETLHWFGGGGFAMPEARGHDPQGG